MDISNFGFRISDFPSHQGRDKLRWHRKNLCAFAPLRLCVKNLELEIRREHLREKSEFGIAIALASRVLSF